MPIRRFGGIVRGAVCCESVKEKDLSTTECQDFRLENEGLCHKFTIGSRQKTWPPNRAKSGLAKKSKKVYLSSPHYCHLPLLTEWRGEGRKE